MDLVEPFLQMLVSRRYATNSLQSHRLDVQRFLKWLVPEGTEPLPLLQRLQPEDLDRYRQDLESVYRPRTIARHFSSLKLFLDFWMQQGVLPRNPVHQVRLPQIEPDQPPDMLEPHEVQALLEAPPLSHYLGLRDRTMLELLYSSGLKVNELLGLNVDDVYLELRFIKVRRKTERMVPITDEAASLLERYLADARDARVLSPADPCLFPGRNGTRISRMGFWAMVRKHAKRAGIQRPLNPRLLRHSFAMHLLQNGMDLTDLRELFGFVSLDATLQYQFVNRPDYTEEYHRYHPRGDDALKSQDSA